MRTANGYAAHDPNEHRNNIPTAPISPENQGNCMNLPSKTYLMGLISLPSCAVGPDLAAYFNARDIDPDDIRRCEARLVSGWLMEESKDYKTLYNVVYTMLKTVQCLKVAGLVLPGQSSLCMQSSLCVPGRVQCVRIPQ